MTQPPANPARTNNTPTPVVNSTPATTRAPADSTSGNPTTPVTRPVSMPVTPVTRPANTSVTPATRPGPTRLAQRIPASQQQRPAVTQQPSIPNRTTNAQGPVVSNPPVVRVAPNISTPTNPTTPVTRPVSLPVTPVTRPANTSVSSAPQQGPARLPQRIPASQQRQSLPQAPVNLAPTNNNVVTTPGPVIRQAPVHVSRPSISQTPQIPVQPIVNPVMPVLNLAAPVLNPVSVPATPRNPTLQVSVPVTPKPTAQDPNASKRIFRQPKR